MKKTNNKGNNMKKPTKKIIKKKTIKKKNKTGIVPDICKSLSYLSKQWSTFCSKSADYRRKMLGIRCGDCDMKGCPK